MKEHRAHLEVAQLAYSGGETEHSCLGGHHIAGEGGDPTAGEEVPAAGLPDHGASRRLPGGTSGSQHRGWVLAAVLASGEPALLSALPAAYLWGPDQRHATGAGGALPHRAMCRRDTYASSPPLCSEDATKCRGIPVTTVPRTLVDLARVLPEPRLARACHEVEVRYETTPEHVEAVLARLPNAPGARTLRRILHGDVQVTLSRLEAGFLKRLEGSANPTPAEMSSAAAPGRTCSRTWADALENPRLMLRELSALLVSNPGWLFLWNTNPGEPAANRAGPAFIAAVRVSTTPPRSGRARRGGGAC
jgi:hypothetical protein